MRLRALEESWFTRQPLLACDRVVRVPRAGLRRRRVGRRGWAAPTAVAVILTAEFALAGAGSAGAAVFSEGTAFWIGGNNSAGVWAADFTGDGTTDLATMRIDPPTGPGLPPSPGQVEVLPADGSGGFEPVQQPAGLTMADMPDDPGSHPDYDGDGIPAGGRCCDGAADYNGDGIMDMVVSSDVNGGLAPPGWAVRVRLGNRDGTFRDVGPGTPVELNGDNTLTDFDAGDFNGDGKLDVAAARWESSSVLLFQGNGDGTLQAPQGLLDLFCMPDACYPYPRAVAVGDFD